ncbi:hypothetical protein Tsubulata_048319, partial [Turnera subulata]
YFPHISSSHINSNSIFQFPFPKYPQSIVYSNYPITTLSTVNIHNIHNSQTIIHFPISSSYTTGQSLISSITSITHSPTSITTQYPINQQQSYNGSIKQINIIATTTTVTIAAKYPI